MIEENYFEKKTKIEDLESKNIEELLSLERLTILFEDIKNIENSNLNFFKKTLDEVEFNNYLIIGNLGNICKTYFESYYEISKKKIENLNEIISIMKLKSFSNSNIENDDFIIIYNNENLSNNNGQKSNEKFIYKDDIFEIIDALSLLNLNNNEVNENFQTNLMTKLKNFKESVNFEELDILKEIKKEKVEFENKIKNIRKIGIESIEFKEVKNILLNDNSDKQNGSCWMIDYLNKSRSNSSLGSNVFTAFKELLEIAINKLYDKKIFEYLDLAIILMQTFYTRKENNNYFLEEEFKSEEIFQKEDFWKNIIYTKIDELIQKINNEKKDEIENKTNFNYEKENIEPILLSFVFAMKDFNLSEEKKRKIIEDVIKTDKYLQYNLDFEKLMDYS